eukprot:766137-Rhodomonas_salina.1
MIALDGQAGSSISVHLTMSEAGGGASLRAARVRAAKGARDRLATGGVGVEVCGPAAVAAHAAHGRPPG